MKTTRAGSSYKEEVLRFLHLQPNSTFTDDRIGVTSVLAEVLQSRGLPVTVATVSNALSTLRKDGRITVTYGHRSLDNKLLITAVVVHSEPRHGVAIGPSEPLEVRGPGMSESHETSNDPIFVMLRRLVRLMEAQPSLSDEDIERFQAHVDHLVIENQTWEALAHETEDGFTQVVEDLRGKLLERDERHALTVAEMEERHQNELKQASEQSRVLRERAERYRLSLETLRAEHDSAVRTTSATNLELETEVASLRSTLESSSQRIAALQTSEAAQRNEFNRLRHLAKEIERVGKLRERQLIVEELYSITRFYSDLFDLFEAIYRQGAPILMDATVLEILGLRDENGRALDNIVFDLELFEQALRTIARENSIVVRPKWVPLKNNQTAQGFAKAVSANLDREMGKVPTVE
jgi:hypothetical protein